MIEADDDDDDEVESEEEEEALPRRATKSGRRSSRCRGAENDEADGAGHGASRKAAKTTAAGAKGAGGGRKDRANALQQLAQPEASKRRPLFNPKNTRPAFLVTLADIPF